MRGVRRRQPSSGQRTLRALSRRTSPVSALTPAPRICIEDGCTTAISKTSKGRCKPCALNRLRNDPAIKARRAAGIAAHHARPEVKEANRARMADFMVNMSEAGRERRREHGRQMVATKLHTPESQAKALAARSVPEVKARRSLSMARTLMPWLPSHLVQAYRDLTRSGLSPTEARVALEPEIPGTAAHTARVLANVRDAQRIRRERDQAQAY